MGADADGNGYIDKSEFHSHVQKIALQLGKDPPTEKEISDMMVDLDQNEDGQLSMDEFKEYVKVTFKELGL
ncbi:unnamed protein product [Moneuplotes crassus]|uniref:EF-hand domain-containing protein n=1 Tax=Euplotes crassus TaxID=5936 RepID=A0AAD1XPD9_EUPCR|nr:unnamed protein product [Moneuplotes crassus]CAI2376500.1 unnamed protein product [Moneuplotes crassus]|eukprot:CAMPEP_0197015150 /NCGR_PEP_ID=MMETSP1380-20130617/73054_1 /TAXON_ID=5936 /ORGANISM="Euplotes crassus, Strain CT5" /LENGTH=70 /DNA_ID=CAMNT_0042440861 /DNA_START=58 /DNA_END=270 /DNA_ORIENTATION=+